MGCASSTEVQHDGSAKHKVGGSYPGNRRPQNKPHAPASSNFNDGTATAHFVSYGGGNALVQQQGGIAKPQVGEKAKYISVTLPQGVSGGQTIHVQAPDGRINEIVVPNGYGPGSTFTVEFMDDAPPSTKILDYGKPEQAYTTATAEPVSASNNNTNSNNTNSGGDDGFATGFNNPNFVPAAPATASLSNDPEINYNSYPSASDARPVFSAPPSYPSAKPY